MKYKRLPIPQKVIRQLQDQWTPLIDRIILAQAIRTEYDHSALFMSEVIGINEAMYHKLCKIAESQCDELIDRVRNNTCSVRLALQLLNEDVQPGTIDWEKHFGYLFISRIKELENHEIIYKGRTNILYRTDDGVYLGVVCRNKEKCCRLDDTPVIVDAIRGWLLKGGFVRWEANQFVLYTPKSEKYGKLSNYIVGLTIKRPFRSVKRLRISYKQNDNQGIHDLRVSNMICALLTSYDHPDACGGFCITRRENNILITDEKRNVVYKTDYSAWLYRFIHQKRDKIRYQARDNRLCIKVGKDVSYLYHVVMAIHLYGEPGRCSDYELAPKLRRFKRNYTQKRFAVDHLDGDITNNCLSNLIILTTSQNSKKENLQSKIKNAETPFFCKQERYDDTSIKAMARFISPDRSPEYLMQGVFTIDEYLDELEKLVHKLEKKRRTK